MSSKDSKELNSLLCGSKTSVKVVTRPPKVMPKQQNPYYGDDEEDDFDEESLTEAYCQWTSHNGKIFVPASKTKVRLTPGVYEIDSNPHIGLYFERIPVKTEGLLRFPDTNSDKVVDEITKFWESEEIFHKYDLSYKRGIILWGPPGCHVAGTQVVLHDGSTKAVENVAVGDQLMGPDGSPRAVLELRRGTDEMLRITPIKGEPFVVNQHHILNLSRSGASDGRWLPSEINIKVHDFLSLSTPAQGRWKIRHPGCVEFSSHKVEHTVPPYFLGLWLGDETECRAEITTADPEIRDYTYEIAASYGMSVTSQRKTDSVCESLVITGGPGNRSNPLLNELRDIGVIDNKHIPQTYLLASEEDRLQLLAGVIDTDGGYETANWRGNTKFKKTGWKGCFEVVQKRMGLSRQILFLARSLGFGAVIKSKVVKGETYWRIRIFGDINRIPTRLPRKQSLVGTSNKNHLLTGIKKIEYVGKDFYYGFTISSDHLYITDDFFVHHNSGKSCITQFIMADVVRRGGIVVKFDEPYIFIDGMRTLRSIQPETPVVVIMEDIDSIIEAYHESEVLNILDGVNEVDKVVFLACPAPETRILKADLTWVRADALQNGDELIAFDEDGPDRRYRTALVRSCPIVQRRRFRVETDKGNIVVSERHPFLVKLGNRPHEWREVESLLLGNRIAFIGKPWETDTSYQGGYMAGQYDGEGTLNITFDAESGSRGFRATWVQAVGEVVEIMKGLLSGIGFKFSEHTRTPKESGRYGPYKTKSSLSVLGGRWESLKLLGTIRPKRLLAHPMLRQAWESCRLTTRYAKVLSVTPVEFGPVVALDTTTGTFIGEGMLQHNTTNYPDRLGARIVNRPSRFDKRFKIGFPSAASRKLYFEYVIGNSDIKRGRKEAKKLGIDLKQWVKDTHNMSIAHLKELFIATVILGDPYDEAIKTLKSMTEEIDDKEYGNFGFDVGGTVDKSSGDGFDEINDWEG